MTAWEIIIGILLIILSILIIAVVLLQQGRQANLGAISGAADSFMEKGKARTVDALLAKWTKVLVVVFMVVVLAGMLVTQYLGA
ncbi:MAG: preprotein translocase subunit SecG [Clostridia bacterium]|nr:preprotein translocase subunit SecG [Clostridia bacterium]